MRKYTFILFTLLFCSNAATCLDTLYLVDFLTIIKENHPLINKANLFDEFEEAYRLKGKGVLDPKLHSNYNRKRFDDTDYYTVWQSEAKIPTRLPIDFSVGYENNSGDFLANDDSVPKNGLVYGTINLNILRGLLFDEQRFQIQAAELNGIKSRIDKNLLLREIIYQAVGAYLDWSKAFYEVEIYRDYLDLVTVRHQNVVELFRNGDSPAVDTIESIVNLNTAEKIFLESAESLLSKQQKLNLFLWNEDGQPLQISNQVIPSELENLLSYLEEISLIISPAFENDPSVRKFQNRINALELTNRLQKEQLKPNLVLKYNTIVSLGKDDFNPTFSLNDYKYGVSFEYPILNRKTKGDIRLNEAMIKQNLYDKTQYQETLANKYVEINARQIIQQDILNIVNQKINNSEVLYAAENLKFQLGESSIFLLNSRERKLLEARTDLIKSFSSIGKLYNERYYLKLGQ